jgi:signal transduction histidine kinase/HAMP domain-containing protein
MTAPSPTLGGSPLHRKVSALLLAASVLPLVVVSALQLQRERAMVRAANVELLQARTDQIGNTLQAMHRGYEAAAAGAARDPEIVAFASGSAEMEGFSRSTLAAQLAAFAFGDPAIRGVGLLDRNGTVVAATERQLEGVSLAYREYFRRALVGAETNPEVYVSMPAVGGVPSIAYPAAVRSRAGEVVGVYVLWVRAQALWDVMATMNDTAGRGSFIALFDRHGVRIGHSRNPKLLFRPSAPLPDEAVRAMLAESRFLEKTSELLSEVVPFPLAEIQGQGRKVFRRLSPTNNVWNLAASRHFPALGWTLVAHVPESEVEVRVASVLPRVLPGCLVGLVLAFFSSAVLMRKVVRPIRDLAGAAAALERGDFSVEPGEGMADRIGARDEVGALARAFRSMATALADRDRSLRARNHDLKQVLDHVGQGFLAIEADGTMSLERSAVVDLWFGEPWPGETVWSYLGREDAELARLMRAGWGSLFDGSGPAVPRVAQLPSRLERGGRTFDLEYRLVASQGPTDRAVLVISDVTAALAKERSEQQMRTELQQAQKMEAVGRLASGIAHDFNNLLAVILSCSEFLLEELPESDARRAEAEEIRQAGLRAARLVRQLLAFARKSPGRPVRTDLNVVVGGIEQLVRRAMGEDIEVSFALSSDPAFLSIDPGQLEQVIMNLAVNARDAMPNGGRLRIETAHDEFAIPDRGRVGQPVPGVALRVSDTGCGIKPELLSKIFEPFFTTKEQGKGTGLGLSTAFGIVQQANGRIEVSSEPGEGTTFTLRFPGCGGAPVDEPLGPAALGIAGDGATILLVEDEDGVRRVANRLLSRSGFRVVEAPNADEALLRFADTPVDLVLTDVVMPGMSGPELVARLQRIRPGLPVVFMSGYSDRQGIWQDGTVVLSKPFTGETMLAKLDEALHAKPPRAQPRNEFVI